MRHRIYVVDDEDSIRSYLRERLSATGHSVECFSDGKSLLDRLADGQIPSVILLDVILPGPDGIETVTNLREAGLLVPVIMLSCTGQIKTVVEAMQAGASNFLMKPFDDAALEAAIEEAVREAGQNRIQPPVSVAVDGKTDGFITANPKMLHLREIVRRVAHTDLPILILGESGAGKEVIARYAHAHSGREAKPFVKVNCAALPPELLESELFGYDKGAFTGALNHKPGKFELADGGTLLLDEIGEISAHLQAKLLQALQDGTFSPLGAVTPVHTNTRIIASTNVRLEDAIRKGEFREDLYFRLNVIRVELPPLRERREDIPQLCQYFIDRFKDHYHSRRRELPPALLNSCIRHDWPGNVRELENFIKRFLLLPDLESISEEFVNARLSQTSVQSNARTHPSLLDVGAEAADLAERNLVEQVLRETEGNRKEAARRLNICYKALLNKLKRWGGQPAVGVA